jgi:sortase A
MSGQKPSADNETRVPLSVVFISLGFLVLLGVTAIWLLLPATMPRPVYAALNSLLPESIVLPTPAAVASVPTLPPQPEGEGLLLPESDISAEAASEENLVTMADALNLGPRPGLPQRIVIPDINLDAPVEKIGVEPIESGGNTYYQWLVPEGPLAGWHDNSALLGQPGNTVLNGHHNVHGEVFRDLVDLTEGDLIILYDADRPYTYRVTHKEIFLERGQPLQVRLQNAQWIAPTPDERITLVTCWPYTDNSHRLVVVAEPVTTGQSTR